MSSILVINAAGRETRVALVENGHIAEFYLERKKDKGVVGNIYKGRVVRVLPGMQAAFVDIGLEKAAFLYVSDVVYDPDFARAQFELTEGEHEDALDVPEESEAMAAEAAHHETGPEPEAEVHEPAPAAIDVAPVLDTAAVPTEATPAPQEQLVSPEPAALETAPVSTVEAAPTSVTETPSVVSAPIEAQAVPAPLVAPEALTPVTEAPPAVAEAIPPVAEAAAPDAAVVAPESTPAEPAVAATDASTSAGEATTTALATPRPETAAGERRAPRENREAAREAREGRRDQKDRERDKDREKDKARKARDEQPQRKREEEKNKPRKTAKIEELLKVGQEVVVQISKDPIGTKGARLTSHISIPGRHLVFMPTVDHVGISRRISNEKERKRLREMVDRFRPPGTGFIVRTVAENVPQEKLESDIRFLIEVWNQVVRRNEKRGGSGLLHPDLDLILRATRDLFAHDVEKLVVDDREEYERILGFVNAQDPALKDRVVLHESDEPIFDAYGIEHELQRATQRKVWLKSGGYLIIDQAEALTAIDVNSGRYVGKKSLEETITKINVEAAKEIVYQLRLRNIGGIIICDFIDMEKPQNRDKVFKSLQEALGRDKAKTNVLRISELGLVEMTRKRVRESIGRVLHEDCPYCDGKGFVKTATTVAYEIFGEIRREAPGYKDPTLVINCNAEVARLLQGEERQELRHLMDRYNKSIQVKAQQNYHREQYDVYGRSAQGGDHKVASSPGSGDGELSMQRRPESGGGERGFRSEGGSGRDRGERGERDRDRSGGGRGDRDRDRDRSGGGRGERDRDRNSGGRGERDRGERDRGGGGRDRDRNRGEQRRSEPREGREGREGREARAQTAPAGEQQPGSSGTPPASSGGGESSGGGHS
ncbi:Rne/Rng family ribonuclease [Cystobacter ferrugineus]|uniref:Ribonuclease G n=1 Tax=Cystobacter ferrugineus TaxID=83449 RepID=A0A1L9AW54_9BACT|nr:Rne/Rng family ribonuclease [Cystobacter ferrugineus]OJH34238.1 ribonuclease G [Cystobacter ferrugineus]